MWLWRPKACGQTNFCLYYLDSRPGANLINGGAADSAVGERPDVV